MNIFQKFAARTSVEVESDLIKTRVRSGYQAILASKASRSCYTDLWDAEVGVFSQWGEDGILWFLCDALEISKPRVVEIGAGNFTECNSRFLAEARNAAVYLIDSRSDLVHAVESLDLMWKNNIHALETWVTPANAAEITKGAKSKLGSIDILSLDIDGLDYWVMSEIDLEGVSIVVVEYNPVFGSEASITVPKTENFDRTLAHSSWLFFGASLKLWISFFKNRNFTFVGTNRVGNNAFFVSRGSDEIFKFIKRPDVDLSKYTDWQIRESRDENGELNFFNLAEAKIEIENMIVTHVDPTGSLTQLRIIEIPAI